MEWGDSKRLSCACRYGVLLLVVVVFCFLSVNPGDSTPAKAPAAPALGPRPCSSPSHAFTIRKGEIHLLFFPLMDKKEKVRFYLQLNYSREQRYLTCFFSPGKNYKKTHLFSL